MDPAVRIQFHLKTRVIFANGSFAMVGAEAARFGRRVLLVTGRRAMRQAGLTQRLIGQLGAAGCQAVLYEGASPNPTTAHVDIGAQLARREQVDVVVGLGGGSAMDTAKAISVAAVHAHSCYELCSLLITDPGLPVIAVPTTSGTGAEVSAIAVVVEQTRRQKTALRSPAVAPAVAVIDPELTLTLPPDITASSGMDALAHAVESYLSNKANPLTELFAERATELVFAHLRTACEDGTNLAARTGMALASLTAGLALTHAGVILGHSVGMTFGGLFGVDHGAAVGLVLPELLEFMLPRAAVRLAQLATRTGVIPVGASRPDDLEVARGFIRAVRRLMSGLPLPESLSSMGCQVSELPALVEDVLRQGSADNHPWQLTAREVEQFLRLLFGWS